MWTKDNYPEVMKKLSEEERNKAIYIANARLKEEVDENQTTLIYTSIRLAKAWMKNKETDKEGPSFTSLSMRVSSR